MPRFYRLAATRRAGLAPLLATTTFVEPGLPGSAPAESGAEQRASPALLPANGLDDVQAAQAPDYFGQVVAVAHLDGDA